VFKERSTNMSNDIYKLIREAEEDAIKQSALNEKEAKLIEIYRDLCEEIENNPELREKIFTLCKKIKDNAEMPAKLNRSTSKNDIMVYEKYMDSCFKNILYKITESGISIRETLDTEFSFYGNVVIYNMNIEYSGWIVKGYLDSREKIPCLYYTVKRGTNLVLHTVIHTVMLVPPDLNIFEESIKSRIKNYKVVSSDQDFLDFVLKDIKRIKNE